MTNRVGRSWGYWTRAKLAILADYLPAFLQASSGKADEFVYLDAFAGEGSGTERLTSEQFPGSARLAVEAKATHSPAQFTRLRYFEQAGKARELEATLRAEYPDRDIKVYGGDCNSEIPKALAELVRLRWAPTFAFIDPDGMQFKWQTLERLADHKRGYRSAGSTKREYKVELWLLFPTQGLVRVLTQKAPLTRFLAEQATRLYGTDQWRAIYELRRAGVLSASEAKEEYVNLMRWRLEQGLGYSRTHPLELKNTRGGTLYHMVFATDNDAGDKIMSDLYVRTASRIPEMRQEARDRKTGQAALDLGVAFEGPDSSYEYEPPWEPRCRRSPSPPRA